MTRRSPEWLADYRAKRAAEVEITTLEREAKRRATKAPTASEADVLRAILNALALHPAVAFVWRQNSAAYKIEDRFIRAGFTGCSDILGMLKGGALLAIEVKRAGGQPTPDQQAFLFNVARGGGCAFVARSVDDALAGIRHYLALVGTRVVAGKVADEMLEEFSTGPEAA